MEAKEVKVGDRLYHCCFGWCKITHPVSPEDTKVLVDLEADEIEYYTIGVGYKSYARPAKGEAHVLYTPISHLYRSEESAKVDHIAQLRRSATNPTIKFWELN